MAANMRYKLIIPKRKNWGIKLQRSGATGIALSKTAAMQRLWNAVLQGNRYTKEEDEENIIITIYNIE
jgi:hypothetical protein